MAGSGSRSGLYFHKSLAPIMVSGVPVPVVSFSIERLRKISNEILAIIYTESEYHFPVSKLDLRAIGKNERGELPSSIAVAGVEAKKMDSLTWPFLYQTQFGFQKMVLKY